MKKTIIFDFDGTIADTLGAGIQIYNSMSQELGLKSIAPEDVPILQSKKPRELMKLYGISKFALPRVALRVKRELSLKMDQIEPFPGVIDVVRDLHASGYRLGIMTSNTKENVELFIKKHNMEDTFEFIYSGKNIFGKSRILRKVIKKEGIDQARALYVGDETRDIEATKDINLPIVSVSWGFNSRDILLSTKPDKLVDTPQELLEYIKTR